MCGMNVISSVLNHARLNKEASKNDAANGNIKNRLLSVTHSVKYLATLMKYPLSKCNSSHSPAVYFDRYSEETSIYFDCEKVQNINSIYFDARSDAVKIYS